MLPGTRSRRRSAGSGSDNPFVRFWRGLDGEDGGRCSLGGEEGTVLVASPDYDGKGKLLVRLDGGDERIVGASRVELL